MKAIKLLKMRNLALLLVCALAQPLQALPTHESGEKIYIAVEGEGRIAVLEPHSGRQIGSIDLSRQEHGQRIVMAPHNVQVAPDGKTVWATANGAHDPAQHQAEPPADNAHTGNPHHAPAAAHQSMQHEAAPADDEVVVIDPASDAIVKRIPIAAGAHLAHVVVTPDGSAAYVTAQNESAIYKIDARNYRVERKMQASPGTQPHGLRLAPDASHAYIALLAGKGLGIIDLHAAQLQILPLNGAAVQTAVTPNGKQVLVSLYDTRQIAVYDVAGKSLSYIDLPQTARGPVQLYPSPDSRFVYVADQGHYFGQPDGDLVFKVDLQLLRVVWSVKAGAAPHGIVVTQDGRHAYVTNLASNDVSILDLKAGRETARQPVGKQPNGVSIWHERTGGTP